MASTRHLACSIPGAICPVHDVSVGTSFASQQGAKLSELASSWCDSTQVLRAAVIAANVKALNSNEAGQSIFAFCIRATWVTACAGMMASKRQ